MHQSNHAHLTDRCKMKGRGLLGKQQCPDTSLVHITKMLVCTHTNTHTHTLQHSFPSLEILSMPCFPSLTFSHLLPLSILSSFSPCSLIYHYIVIIKFPYSYEGTTSKKVPCKKASSNPSFSKKIWEFPSLYSFIDLAALGTF